MKINTLKTLLFLLFASFLLSSSCRFEEGPIISLRSIKGRLIGKWQDNDFVDSKIEIRRNGEFWVFSQGDFLHFGYWELKPDNTLQRRFTSEISLEIVDKDGGDKSQVQLIRLTNKEMKLRTPGISEVFTYRKLN